MVKVFTHGLMEEYTKDNGARIKCMVKVNSLGQMEGTILGDMFKIKKKAMEFLLGLMEESMQVNGKKENNQEKVNIKEAMEL